MAPDLPYFTPVGTAWPTHAPWAIPTLDAGLGLIAWALWHVLIVAPFLAVAPAPITARLAGIPVGLQARIRSLRDLALTYCAVVLGAATHVLWDEFTHNDRWGETHIGFLAEAWGPMPGWHWAQYASGVIGLAVLGVWAALWYRRTPPAPGLLPVDHPWSVRYPWALVAVVVAGLLGAAAGAYSSPGGPHRIAFIAVITAGGTAMAALLLLAIAWHAYTRLAAARVGQPHPRRSTDR